MTTVRLPPKEYGELYAAVLERDDYKCRSCGARQGLSVHHIIFRSDEGPDESWNLITLCLGCHNGIHIDVQDGIHGLVIVAPANADEAVKFIRAPGWVPG